MYASLHLLSPRRSHRWWGSFQSRWCKHSSREKNARHGWPNWQPTSTHICSILVLCVDLKKLVSFCLLKLKILSLWPPHEKCLIWTTSKNHPNRHINIFTTSITSDPGWHAIFVNRLKKDVEYSFGMVVSACLHSDNLTKGVSSFKVLPNRSCTVWQYPSTKPWITIPHNINLWWLSQCQSAFGREDVYFQRRIAACCWIVWPRPSTRWMDWRTQHFWTRTPWVLKNPTPVCPFCKCEPRCQDQHLKGPKTCAEHCTVWDSSWVYADPYEVSEQVLIWKCYAKMPLPLEHMQDQQPCVGIHVFMSSLLWQAQAFQSVLLVWNE